MISDLEKLNQLHKNTIANLATYFLARIKILNQPTSNKHRNSPAIETLQEGDIVIDKNRVLKTGSCVGALCRVAKLAPGERVALVVHLKKGMKKNPDFIKQTGVFCKQNHHQPCVTCDHTQKQMNPLKVLAVETAQVYFITRGPKADDSTSTNLDPTTGHLSGPTVTQGDKRFILPEPQSITTPEYGTQVPLVNHQDPEMLKYKNPDPATWLNRTGSGSAAYEATPIASESEKGASFPTADDSDDGSDSIVKYTVYNEF